MASSMIREFREIRVLFLTSLYREGYIESI